MSLDDRREYEGDVIYAVWRRGGNVDAVNYDRVDDCFYDGRDADETASRELRIQRGASKEAEHERSTEG